MKIYQIYVETTEFVKGETVTIKHNIFYLNKDKAKQYITKLQKQDKDMGWNNIMAYRYYIVEQDVIE